MSYSKTPLMPQNNNTPQQKSSDTSNTLFCYEVDSTHIFIEPKIKMEVLEQSIIYPIPNAPKWYLGVTSLRGDILTIVNMHYLLGGNENNKTKRLLKLDHPNFPPLVLAIDTLPYQRDITALMENNISNDKQFPNWITSLSTNNKHTFLFADHAVLFNALQGYSATTQSTGGNK